MLFGSYIPLGKRLLCYPLCQNIPAVESALSFPLLATLPAVGHDRLPAVGYALLPTYGYALPLYFGFLVRILDVLGVDDQSQQMMDVCIECETFFAGAIVETPLLLFNLMPALFRARRQRLLNQPNKRSHCYATTETFPSSQHGFSSHRTSVHATGQPDEFRLAPISVLWPSSTAWTLQCRCTQRNVIEGHVAVSCEDSTRIRISRHIAYTDGLCATLCQHCCECSFNLIISGFASATRYCVLPECHGGHFAPILLAPVSARVEAV